MELNNLASSNNLGLEYYSDKQKETLENSATNILKTSANLSLKDKFGGYSARLGLNRDSYKVEPGIYSLGEPDKNSDVLVSANYKLSFDVLRKECKNLNVWILVLDTKGINVWCAAGKGTFGTIELINRIYLTNLDKIVNHKKLIVPQLGAVGVSAFEVKKKTGFKVHYGPVRAEDIKNFINNDYTKTKEEMKVRFNLKDRMAVVPVELTHTFKPAFKIFIAIMLLKIISNLSLEVTILEITKEFLPFALSIVTGTVIFPILLPFIPFRIFAIKGALLGIVFSVLYTLISNDISYYALITNILLFTPIITYLSMNFTGSTTYTTLKGVQIEVKYSIPVIILSLVIGIIMKLICCYF